MHKLLGCGFLEKVYQEALAEEFRLRGIPFEREKVVRVRRFSHRFRIDTDG
nr:MAG TPA: GxxExxY protein [Caudoviricetes sp.]